MRSSKPLMQKFIQIFLVFFTLSGLYGQDNTEIANENYNKGMASFSEENWGAAREYFLKSFEAVKHTQTAYLLSCTLMKLDQDQESREYAQYVLDNQPALDVTFQNIAKQIIDWADYRDGLRMSASMRRDGPSTFTPKPVYPPKQTPLPDANPWTAPAKPQPPAIETTASSFQPDPNMWYRLTNSFLGDGRSLDTYSGTDNRPFMGQTGNYSGQYWRFTAVGNGYYRMTNSFLKEDRSFDTYSNGENQPFMGKSGGYSGQFWKITRLDNGYFRFTNSFLGDGRSLDTYSGEVNDPFMGQTGNYSGQFWKLTPISRIK